jgi:hypothetical protein
VVAGSRVVGLQDCRVAGLQVPCYFFSFPRREAVKVFKNFAKFDFKYLVT